MSDPSPTSTAVDVLDDWANQHGDLDTRLRTIPELLERMTRPEAPALVENVIAFRAEKPLKERRGRNGSQSIL